MGKNGGAVAFDMLVEPDTGRSLGHDRCERGLAHFQRIGIDGSQQTTFALARYTSICDFTADTPRVPCRN